MPLVYVAAKIILSFMMFYDALAIIRPIINKYNENSTSQKEIAFKT